MLWAKRQRQKYKLCRLCTGLMAFVMAAEIVCYIHHVSVYPSTYYRWVAPFSCSSCDFSLGLRRHSWSCCLETREYSSTYLRCCAKA